ncbi:MAG: hypothetical protein GY841_02535, partial [FCB group bacterium]|nr:hypothetical protein [FCB group bacterium]
MKRFVVLLLCLSGVSLYAQNGRWVEHTLDNFASGSPMYARGDGCLGYTENNADRLLIFDIDVHEWEEVVLEKAQAFEALTTEGQVVFAYSDSLLFGYSAVSQTWDTITYTGDFMSGSEHQYECGDYLAYLATADYLYVFDAAIGYWQYYDHGFSGEFTFAVFWVKDDYMAMAMARNSPGQPKNVVYSAHTHTFNEITDGIGRPSPQTDHGFAGMFNIDYNNTDYRLIGYSALSNTFDVVNYSCGDNESSVGGTGSGAMAADEFTVYTQTFRYVVPHESVTANFYGFDTRRGAWDHSVVNFDWTVDRYYGGWYQCGQFSFDKSLFTADDSYHIFIYSGIDGQFRDFTPGLIYKSTTSAFRGGGTIFGVFDTLNAWGYDVAGDRGSLQALALDKTANFEQGDDYLTLTRWSTTSDDMITYFYNGNTNRWTSVTVPDNHTTDGIKTEHIYLHRGYPEQEIIFYSAIKDTIIKVDFADGTYAGSRVRGVLGFTTSEARSVLFDGLNGASYEADFEFDRFGLGMQSGVFCDTSDDTWYGYSTLFGNLTPLATSEEPYYVLDTGYIGLVTVSYPEKVYT